MTPELQHGLQLHQQGRVPEAIALYEQVLRTAPQDHDALHYLGVAYKQTGRTAEAVGLLVDAIRVKPDAPAAHNNLGSAYLALDALDQALACFDRAIVLAPRYAMAYVNRGVVLSRLQRFEEAFSAYRQVAGLEPQNADAYYNMGVVLQALERFDEALDCYQKAIERAPGFFEAWINGGSTAIRKGAFETALAASDQALRLQPESPEAHHNRGLALAGLKRNEEALRAQDEAVRLRPAYAKAWVARGGLYLALGEVEQSLASYTRALNIDPESAQAWSGQQATSLRAEFAEAHYHLGSADLKQKRVHQAIEHFEQAVTLQPGQAESHSNLGVAQDYLGNPEQALRHYEQALLAKPDYAVAYSNKAFVLAYNALASPQEYLQFARGWERAMVSDSARRAAHTRVLRNPDRAGRRLKIGYVSGDFRQHAVSYFIEQLFARHDRSRVDVYAYYSNARADEVTARLRALADHWVPLAELTDVQARDRVEADGIDVLIDLSGHSSHARLGIFALRAAPVQAHYIGYFASTGLTEMDYWIGDPVVTPPELDEHFSEQPWRLPHVWMRYDGKPDAPAIDWAPQPDGTLWLGSFNSLRKLKMSTLNLWARVLQALPEGRLLLKTEELAVPDNRERILRVMRDCGVAPERIELLDGSSTPDWNSHMACYNRLDVALDPVDGMGGATTTCDALWMGVPVIALAGDRMAARAAASMIAAAGHPEWVARDEAQYLEKTVALAYDRAHRAALRPLARQRMAGSPLCDTGAMARELEAAYEAMFDRRERRPFAEPAIQRNAGP